MSKQEIADFDFLRKKALHGNSSSPKNPRMIPANSKLTSAKRSTVDESSPKSIPHVDDDPAVSDATLPHSSTSVPSQTDANIENGGAGMGTIVLASATGFAFAVALMVVGGRFAAQNKGD